MLKNCFNGVFLNRPDRMVSMQLIPPWSNKTFELEFFDQYDERNGHLIPVKFILMLTQLQVWRQQWNKIERFNAFSNDHFLYETSLLNSEWDICLDWQSFQNFWPWLLSSDSKRRHVFKRTGVIFVTALEPQRRAKHSTAVNSFFFKRLSQVLIQASLFLLQFYPKNSNEWMKE